jgi:zinc transport system substrate-binding protein
VKKIIVHSISICVVVVLLLSGCGNDIVRINSDDKLNIVCTTFPQYDWLLNITEGAGDDVALTLLMDKGGDLHNFQPSALDIAKVSGCDVFIYVGGESDVWVEDALKEAINPDLVAINMMEVVENYGALYEEEHFEGVQEDNAYHEHGEEDNEYDEHIWLSLRNAAVLVEHICDIISEVDSENAALYSENCDKYVDELLALDKEYINVVNQSANNTLLFADRFPFRYMVEDYGLEYYAAFEGCSAETEASFNTVAYLSDRLSLLGLNAVSVIDGSDKRLAHVIIENSDNKDSQIVVFDSMQSVSKSDIEKGVTYLSAMKNNLTALRTALAG